MSERQRAAAGSAQVDVTDLVERAQRGERRAFDALVRCFRPRIYALALHITGSASEADDVTQDTFVKAFQHLPAFEGRSHFFTWLYRIAIHRALNAKRDSRRRGTQSLDDVRVRVAVQVDAGNDPHLAAELRESYTHLLAAFDELTPVLRSTVALVALQGLSHKAAAKVLETNEGTIAWRIHEARRQLRQSIDERTAQPKSRAHQPQREHASNSLLARLSRTPLPS